MNVILYYSQSDTSTNYEKNYKNCYVGRIVVQNTTHKNYNKLCTLKVILVAVLCENDIVQITF